MQAVSRKKGVSWNEIVSSITLAINLALKSLLEKTEKPLDVIVKEYLEWVKYDEYLIFQQTKFHSPTRFIASLSPKRGNKKYAHRIKQRFKELSLPFEYQKQTINNVSETTTNVLFITLTCDQSQCHFKTSWDAISCYWNKFMANMRKQFGRVLSVRCFESSQNGYAHIHAILYFQDQKFPTFLKWSNKKAKHLWRIPFPIVEKIRRYWQSFIDIQGMLHIADGFKYLGKYISKSSDLSEKAENTLALTWKFHKRAFSLGSKFRTEIFNRYLSLDLTHISITQTFSSQMTLDGQELKETLPSFLKVDFEKVKMLGFLPKKALKKLGGLPKDEWTFGLTERQQKYALYKFKGIKDKKKEKETIQQWIKNPWKYLGELDELGRTKTREWIAKQSLKKL